MKYLASWSLRPGHVPEIAKRFLAGEAAPVPGVTLLGRWHRADGSGGFSLYETDNPALLYEGAARWIDVLEIHGSVVIEDAQAGPALARYYGK